MRIRTTASALCLLAGPVSVAAPADRVDFSAEAATGIEYDANVNVLDLDTHTGAGDAALLTNLGFGADVALTESAGLKLGYDWSQTLYRDLSDHDLSIRHASAALKYDAGVLDAGLGLHHVDAQLGGDDFLALRRVSPSVAKLFGERLYLRGAWVRNDKELRAEAGRSAVNHAFSADAFLFLDGAQRYVAFGWTTADEDAESDDFDYDGDRLKLAYAQRLEWLAVAVVVRSRLQLERRDYRQVLEAASLLATGSPHRSDERLRAALQMDVPVNEWLAVESAVEYASNASNLASADFDEMRYSVRVAAAF